VLNEFDSCCRGDDGIDPYRISAGAVNSIHLKSFPLKKFVSLMCRENSRRYDCDNHIRQRYNGVNEIIRCERAYSVLIRRIGLLFSPPFIQQKRKKKKQSEVSTLLVN
jgi:hypothetical protein